MKSGGNRLGAPEGAESGSRTKKGAAIT